MKKSYFIILILMITTSMYPAESSTSSAKAVAMKQFNISLDRFKRCTQGKCTKIEALKVARDLGIAAAAVITAVYLTEAGLYLTGAAIKKTVPSSSRFDNPEFENYSPMKQKVYKGARKFARQLQTPAIESAAQLKKPVRKIQQYFQGPQKGDMVQFDNQLWYVDNYDTQHKVVTIVNSQDNRMIGRVPVSQVTILE